MIRAICIKCKGKAEYHNLHTDACQKCGEIGHLAPLIPVEFPTDEENENWDERFPQ